MALQSCRKRARDPCNSGARKTPRLTLRQESLPCWHHWHFGKEWTAPPHSGCHRGQTPILKGLPRRMGPNAVPLTPLYTLGNPFHLNNKPCLTMTPPAFCQIWQAPREVLAGATAPMGITWKNPTLRKQNEGKVRVGMQTFTLPTPG